MAAQKARFLADVEYGEEMKDPCPKIGLEKTALARNRVFGKQKSKLLAANLSFFAASFHCA